MRQTLFHIPHELFGLPVFGFGWGLIVWAIVSVAILFWLHRRQGWNDETISYVPVLGVLGIAIAFLLPGLEEFGPPLTEGGDGVPLGLPIRGYGVFLLLAVVSGIGLAAWRARLVGLDPEVIFSLAIGMFVLGILGARGFYVAQYWNDQFYDPADWWGTLRRVVDISKGGLIVFGSLVGGLLAAILFCRARQLKFLAVADLIAPSLVLGLAIGRLGCLMNGCCYGGLCEHPWALQFPAGSHQMVTPPYAHQLQLGQLHGFTLAQEERPDGEREQVVIRAVLPNSPAAAAGLRQGDVVRRINRFDLASEAREPNGRRVEPLSLAHEAMIALYRGAQAGRAPELRLELADERQLDVTLRNAGGQAILPEMSLPIHPTQIYAAINAGLLTLLLLAFYPYRTHNGAVIALLLTLYPIVRIAEEILRDDEGNFFAGLTISQNISVALLIAAALLWLFVFLHKPLDDESRYEFYEPGSAEPKG